VAEVLALVDYGAGNLRSVANALKAAGAEGVAVTADPQVVRAADRIVLPGVGAFKACVEALRSVPGMVEAMAERVLVGGAPFLGICVGMQLMADRGIEFGVTEGLGWIGGEVRPIERTDPAIKVPHMGWNDVEPMHHSPLIVPGEAYFLHSYHFVPTSGASAAAMTDHGGGLVAAVAQGNILGVQFHPEKSQDYGIALLERFLEWKP
jgi:imidazole glycerol-phosphate synthase subunit HisH